MKRKFLFLFSTLLALLLTVVTALQITKVSDSAKRIVDLSERDNIYIEIEYRTKILSTRVNNLITYMKENDDIGLLDDKFVNSNLYKDLIIYGDESYTQANDIESKILFLNNIVGNFNYYSNEVNLFLYSKRFGVDYYTTISYLNDISEYIEKTNSYIYEYNTDLQKEEQYSYITNFKNFYPDLSKTEKKDLKEKYKEYREEK